MYDRRAFLHYFSTAGLGSTLLPGVLWARVQQQQDTITKEMVKDAEAHTAEDKRRRQEVEVRNQADALVYNTEKTLNENRDKIPATEASAIEAALKEAKEAIESGSTDRIREKMDLLTKASHRLAEVMYQQTAGKQKAEGAPGGGSGKKPDDDVVDAEFEEKK